jgi:hypothetical protein
MSDIGFHGIVINEIGLLNGIGCSDKPCPSE